MTNEQNQAGCQATLEEICDDALKHYEEISKEACSWNSLVPKAIEFYKSRDKLLQKHSFKKMIEGMKKDTKTKETGTRIKIVELPSGKIGYNKALDDILNKLK